MQVDRGKLRAYYKLTCKEKDRESYDTPPETVVKGIDSILYELQELRWSILEKAQHSEGNLAEELYGALGQGTWDE